MFTIIGGDGKEYGPVTADQIRAWIAAGRANLDTQARPVGTTEWRKVGDFAEFNPDSGVPLVPPTLGAAPVRPAGPVNIKAFADDLIARAAPLDVFNCLGRSFELWKSHFLPLVGVTLLVVFAQVVASMIPIIGILSGLLLNGVFYGGLYYYYLGLMRGERREVGDAFAGFTKSFVPLMLATLLTAVLTLAILMLFFAPMVPFFVKVALQGASGGMPAMPGGWFLFGCVLGVLVAMYFSISWAFTFGLVIDQGLGPWTALEVSRRVITKQWFRVFFLMLLAGILTMLGVIGLFIGIFFTLPLMFGAILYAYEDLCRPPAGTAPSPVTLTPPS